MTKKLEVKKYMLEVAAKHRDPAGILDPEHLAEDAAKKFGHEEWLDNENHWVRGLALDIYDADILRFIEEEKTEI